MEIKTPTKIVYSECLLHLVVLCVWCCYKCVFFGGHFVMVSLNLTCLHYFHHFFNIYLIYIMHGL